MTEEMRQKALRWLIDEARSCQIAPEINGCKMRPEWQERICICNTAIEALKAFGPIKPVEVRTDKLQKIQELHEMGLRNVEISREMGISQSGVTQALKELGLTKNRTQYAVYDKRNGECLIAMGTLEEIAQATGLAPATILHYMSRPPKKYEVVRVG